ncbi:hypothetical protein Q669_29420 [Labrenzia sp. C1B10]|uniref:phage tail protein n=1 Tax=unclassified Labrenzia TaxID=2648686 RepID=UPI0003B86CD0|nr:MULTISPECIES: phage tail protein [unclassified Labrenzia]ERP95691.1 hypothetical protein Q669_29420 [Labrenzia sp. C1B10]ERS05757.1 hypothetical protein Q675_28985 [Labrenzia sp. C1B70]
MSDDLVFAIEGITSLADVKKISPAIERNIRFTVNKGADKARTLSAGEIQNQVNFPASYLRGDKRLAVTKRAQGNNLEAEITGRRRPTSLARFIVGGTSKRGGVSVSVQPGSSATIKRGFILKLRSGTASLDQASNRGLAIRLKPGEKPSRAYKPFKIGDGLYLLYGPSVDQVFKTVRQDVQGDVLDFMENEFLRLMESSL